MHFEDTHSQFCFDTAIYFTAVRGFGRNRTRNDFTKYADAIRYADTYQDTRTMIYAVNDLGNSAHLHNA